MSQRYQGSQAIWGFMGSFQDIGFYYPKCKERQKSFEFNPCIGHPGPDVKQSFGYASLKYARDVNLRQ